MIRENDAKKTKRIFAQYHPEWSDEDWRATENIVSGIEYATMMKTSGSAPLDVRIAGAVGAILLIYGVPEEIRERKIQKVLATDYRALGRRVLKEFRDYVNGFDESAFEQVLNKIKSYDSEEENPGE